MNNKPQRQRADLPTLLMHWALVASLLVSVSTGWRIASMADSNPLMRWVDVLLLQGNVLRWHFLSAAALTALTVAYVVFLVRMGLGGRLALRLAALRSPDRHTRWQALNKLVYWIAFALLTGAAATGTLLYFFPGTLPSEPLVQVHQWLSWGFVAYVVLHVVAQVVAGGIRALLKIVTPRLAYGVGALAATSAGLAGAAVATWPTPTWPAGDRAQHGRASADGDASDAAWQSAPESRCTRCAGSDSSAARWR